MNQVILMGRLCRDPEVRYSAEGLAVARYTLAVNRYVKDSNETDFINCVAFDKRAEFAEKYFRQGLRVCVSGFIRTGSYTNKDGRKIYTTDVVVNSQEFADSKQNSSRPAPADVDGFMNIPEGVDDELPFK